MNREKLSKVLIIIGENIWNIVHYIQDYRRDGMECNVY